MSPCETPVLTGNSLQRLEAFYPEALEVVYYWKIKRKDQKPEWN